MTVDEWHGHFNEMMTRLSEAQKRLKDAALHSNEFHRAHEDVRAGMEDLDRLTNLVITKIEPQAPKDTEAAQSENK